MANMFMHVFLPHDLIIRGLWFAGTAGIRSLVTVPLRNWLRTGHWTYVGLYASKQTITGIRFDALATITKGTEDEEEETNGGTNFVFLLAEATNEGAWERFMATDTRERSVLLANTHTSSQSRLYTRQMAPSLRTPPHTTSWQGGRSLVAVGVFQ